METRTRSKPQVTKKTAQSAIGSFKYEKKQKKAIQQRKSKQSVLFSLCDMFLESKNEPQLILPWMKGFKQLEQKIIGTNYIIIGPAQSGKYSAVRYALGKFHPGVIQININCDVSTTQHQFISRMIEQFKTKFSNVEWPKDDSQVNKIIVNENIQFQRLNYYILPSKLKFVIVIRNGEHLIGFKKQTILYSLFEWMNTQKIKAKAGLVIMTRQLMFTDRLEKRIKSRFSGNRLCICRPEDPSVYIDILVKRIQALINDKQYFLKDFKLKSSKMEEENPQQDQNSDNDLGYIKKDKLKKQQTLKISQNIKRIVKKYPAEAYIKDLKEYYNNIVNYINLQNAQDLHINNFFCGKLKLFEKQKLLKKQEKLHFFSEDSILSIEEQISCLYKLKQAVEKNGQMKAFFKNKILEYQIISIPFVLRIFQHIFLTMDEGILKFLPVNHLKSLIFLLLKKNVEYQFPINVIECNSLENFNNVELLLLILIYKMIDVNKSSCIKLKDIYHEYKSVLNKHIYENSQISSNKFPTQIIVRSLDRLYRCQTIHYNPENAWNSQINLLYQKKKVLKGLQHLSKVRKFPQILEDTLNSIQISSSSMESEQIVVHITLDK